MSRLSLLTEWHGRKLELPIMPVLKFGKRSRIVPNAIFGRLDVCFMRWQGWSHHLWALISSLWRRPSSVVFTRGFQRFTQISWRHLLDFAWKLIRRKDFQQVSFWTTSLSKSVLYLILSNNRCPTPSLWTTAASAEDFSSKRFFPPRNETSRTSRTDSQRTSFKSVQ